MILQWHVRHYPPAWLPRSRLQRPCCPPTLPQPRYPGPARKVARPPATARLCGLWTAYWPDHRGQPSGGDMWLGKDGRFYNVWMGKIYEGRWEVKGGTLYLHVEHLNGLPSCGTYPVSIRRIEPDRMIGDPMSMERKR